MEFQELAAQRHALQDFCQQHASSLAQFQSGHSFKVLISEADLIQPARHLTTTATCIESLLNCPTLYRLNGVNPEDLASQFADNALGRPQDEWMSEGSAQVYCRCRALPLVIGHVNSHDPRVTAHLKHIFNQLKIDPDRFAIGETAPPRKDGTPEIDCTKWYLPNAFHTYWTLEVLEVLNNKFPTHYQEISNDPDLLIEERKRAMILWARHALGVQVSLHAAESSVLDTDQLGWSLAIVLKFWKVFGFDLAEQDLIREAVRRLFQTQLEVGTWRHYRSLFHYRDAGNAYCYVFETFAVLLRIALADMPSGQFFRQCLRERVDNLIRFWQYANRTRIHLSQSNPNLIGWCSGHRINQRDAEGWATASVFSFAQNLRRLVGIWTRQEALTGLSVRTPKATGREAIEEIGKRGETCRPVSGSVADQLCTMFVHPIDQNGTSDEAEPDEQPIAKDQARSAILFGPPGTSKTYLAGCVAGAIGWKYIEVHASHFVAQGLPAVQRTADEIFSRLMELDHTVVLFDEIDELVREREQEHDAFGRFLTTSMLPKLAELWQQRKVVYFVATNHIRYFDIAITRSQRFDALILVGPPSYAAKIRRLQEYLKEHVPVEKEPYFEDIEDAIEEQLRRAGGIGDGMKDMPLSDHLILAKFALLRHDQLEELAHHLSNQLDLGGEPLISREMMENALRRIADQRLRKYAPYVDLVNDREYPRRDYEKVNVWQVEGLDPNGSYPPFIKNVNGRLWVTARSNRPPLPPVQGYKAELRPLGLVTFIASS